MAMTRPANTSTTLECGRDLDDVWTRIGAPPDAHELTCPYCQDARAGLAELAAATKGIDAADRTNPVLQLPTGTMTDIMTLARTEARRGRILPLRPPPRGPDGSPTDTPGLNISELAVATIVRQASDLVDGVQTRRCRLEPAEQGDAAEISSILVDLSISVTKDAAIPALTKRLREAIMAAVTARIGVAVSRLDVLVEDVHDA